MPTKRDDTRFERPLVTVDLTIFSVRQDRLAVLLVRRPTVPAEPFPGRHALPGGFVDVHRDQDLEDSALRKLREKTGVRAPYLEQLGSWGGSTRDPRGWSATHAYFSLIAPADSAPESEPTTEFEWVEVQAALRETLAFDHSEILRSSVDRLRSKVEYTSLPAFLLPEPFTLPQLQHVYEVVLGRSVDKSAFRKRMLDAGFLREAALIEGGIGRPAQGYVIVDRRFPAVFPRPFKAGE